MYNIVMFAYNEEQNIENSIMSVWENVSSSLNKFYLIVNGSTDKTAELANKVKTKLGFHCLHIVEIELGDKCNAWNHYQHKLADVVDCHFFVDADVQFSAKCFDKMHRKLMSCTDETVAIAGMPLSGRNIDFYRSLVIERACFFGNLYGLKHSFINLIREKDFKLPVGLNWIDSFLTKAVNTDITFGKMNIPNRVTYLEGVGYTFDSLSPLKQSDIKLYFNRIARYELGKIQEKYLDALDAKDWPDKMFNINCKIYENLSYETNHLSLFKKYLVVKRLKRLLKND